LARGDLEHAGVLWGACETEAERLPGWVDERARRAGSLLGEIRPEFVAAFGRGRELDLWDAAGTALGEDGQTVP